MTIHKAKIEIGTPETGYRQKEAGELPFIGSIKLIAVFSDADRTDKVIDAVRSAMRERQSARQTG